MQPTWLLVLSCAALILGLASAAIIAVDEFVRDYRQPIKIMDLIWPVTALYFGPAAIVAYGKIGRPLSPKWRNQHGNPTKRSRRETIVIHICHCSAHCTLGAIIASAIVLAVGITIAGDTTWPEYIGDYLAAVAIGFAFRYSTESRQGGARARAAIRTVVRADLLSVSTFELALFVWLALMDRLLFSQAPRPNNPEFWFIVQIGLIIGFFAACPATSWLVRRGIKTDPAGTPQ